MTTIRPVRLADVPEIVDIETSSFSTPWETDIFETFAGWDGQIRLGGNGIGFMKVAEIENVVVGYIVWNIYLSKMKGHLANIAVRKENRCIGIGTDLMKHMFDDLIKREVVKCYLEVRESNLSAQRFYEKNGMTPSGRVKDYYETEDAIIYSIYF